MEELELSCRNEKSVKIQQFLKILIAIEYLVLAGTIISTMAGLSTFPADHWFRFSLMPLFQSRNKRLALCRWLLLYMVYFVELHFLYNAATKNC